MQHSPQLHQISLSVDGLRELADQPLKLSEYQLSILIARTRMQQQLKLEYNPDFSTEENIRKSIRNMAQINGALELLTDLVAESTNTYIEEEE